MILLHTCIYQLYKVVSLSPILCDWEGIFVFTGMDQVSGGGWDHVLAAMQIPDLNIEDFLRTALDEGTFLLLYGYIVQKLPLCQQLMDEQILIGYLLNWITNAKPM